MTVRADIHAILDYYLAVVVAALATPATDDTPAIPYAGKAFVQPGGEVAWDQCDCDGQVWARFVQATPIYDTPKANGQPCVVRWDVTLAVGILKCAAPSAPNLIPSAEQLTEGGHVFADDLLTLMEAIECDPRKHRVTQAIPLGPQGGCAGSEVQFTVRMQPCCD